MTRKDNEIFLLVHMLLSYITRSVKYPVWKIINNICQGIFKVSYHSVAEIILSVWVSRSHAPQQSPFWYGINFSYWRLTTTGCQFRKIALPASCCVATATTMFNTKRPLYASSQTVVGRIILFSLNNEMVDSRDDNKHTYTHIIAHRQRLQVDFR